MLMKRGSQGFSVVHPHAAGIDIGATFHIVAVSRDCDPNPVRRFQSFTTDLHKLSKWLHEVGVTSVAMESTGVYWIPVFEILESDGFEVILVNAREGRFRRTTDSRHPYALASNLLIERSQTEGVWASDMTFVPTSEGWLYVAAVMNVKSRRIIGLCMSDKLSQELASDALRDAVGRQSPSEELIHHSDRGRQYASYAYQELLREYGMTPSMSRSGNCYDNAYVESFFGTLKTELVHGERYRSRLEARLSIFEYVEVYYNRQRSHSALGYRSPEQYEKLLHET